MKHSKRYRQATEAVTQPETNSSAEAVEMLKKMPSCKFDETLELSCKLNVDPKQSEQMVRGSVVLPHGTGKDVRIVVFCEPEKEADAKAAGAEHVGSQDLVDKITKDGWVDFDCCIATPGMMRFVSKLGKVLGPRGLMPSPKTGTLTENVVYAVKEAKRGKIDFRMDKSGAVQVGLGKMSFSSEALLENLNAFKDALLASKPPAVKGELFRVFYLSTTMSPSVRVLV